MSDTISYNEHLPSVPYDDDAFEERDTLQAKVNEIPPDATRPRQRCGLLLGSSAAMQRVYQLIERVAETSATVFITGESGTGKEVVARTVHELSARRAQVFLPVNCGAISPQLIESELFGHEKGSFTGAARQHKGYFERADGGTLFLDEITEMPLELQMKLLRVLETSALLRIGSNREIKSDVRVIAATNCDPRRAVADGKLRADLFYRLHVFPLHLPPLLERSGDVELLAEHFLDQLNRAERCSKRFAPETLEQLKAYHWPGSVRELKNVIQRAFIIGNSVISPDPACVHHRQQRDQPGVPAGGMGPVARCERAGVPGPHRQQSGRSQTPADPGDTGAMRRHQARRGTHARNQPEDALHPAAGIRDRG
jgi:transcriptional regulator with GAF, ATPase, and Fis domain